MNIILDKSLKTDSKQPKVFNLGQITTTLQDLLDNSTIIINGEQTIILSVIDENDNVLQYLLPLDYKGESFYGLGKNILETNLISLGSLETKPYKVYTAILTQTGTNAPIATELENTLGGTLVWTRDTTGQYTGTLNGAFTENKTFITTQFNATLTPPSGGYVSGILGERNDNDSIHLITFDIPSTDTGDGILNETPIEIRVYD